MEIVSGEEWADFRPSLGDIVAVTVDPRTNNNSDTAPAVITAIHSNNSVNLRVFIDGPDVRWFTSVPLYATREDLEQARSDNAHPQGLTWNACYWIL